eukprot:maker-scaffold_14-snap-gene-5.68-mRNA-1 protein AED:0.65 eAED:0.65 QI:0/0/0/0.5/1/1/2/0/256
MEELDDFIEEAAENGVLDISSRGYREIDASVFTWGHALVKLDLSKNSIVDLTAHLGELNMLHELFADQNEIESLPEEIGKLNKLKVLNLANNRLLLIPDVIEQCVLLDTMDLSQNYIQTLPATIGNLKLLKNLYVQNNQLKEIEPSLCFCLSLIEIDFSQNPDINNMPLDYLSDARIVLYICGHLFECRKQISQLGQALDDTEKQVLEEQRKKLKYYDQNLEFGRLVDELVAERPAMYLGVKRKASYVKSVLCSLS